MAKIMRSRPINSKTLFIATSPRTPFKMLPEIALLDEEMRGLEWNSKTQTDFYHLLRSRDFFEGEESKTPALSARDRINRSPKALGFISLPIIGLTPVGKEFVETNNKEEILLRQMLKFQIPSPYHPLGNGAADFCVKPYLELFRLISSIFLHGVIIHLLCNMYSLYVIGPQLESFFGKTKFIVIYILSGVIGNLLSMTFLQDNVVSVGASGAIFGLLGALLYFGYHYRVYLSGVIRSQIIPLILLNLTIGFLSAGINNVAHIGGLIGGILITMAVGVKYKSSKSDIINGIIMTIIFLSFLAYMIFFK